MEVEIRCRISGACALIQGQRVSGLAAEGSIEELDGVHNGRFLMPAGEGGLELENAAGIAGGHNVGTELGNEFGFAIAESFCGAGLHQIVDSGRAAADGSFGDFRKLQTRDASEQRARLAAHALRMLQVTGIVKCHAQLQRMACGAWIKTG